MANTFSWTFPALDVIYDIDGYTDVVQAVHWVYQGTNGNIYEQIVGCTPLPLPMGTFVDFRALTPEIVTGWVVTALGQDKVDEMTAEIDKIIAAKEAPKGGSEAPPWA